MDFKTFSVLHRKYTNKVLKEADVLFKVSIPNLWEIYLESYPPEHNQIFRERREMDCSCCKSFIRQFGDVVAIKDFKIVSMWDFQVDHPKFDTMLKVMSNVVQNSPIADVFVTKESAFGTGQNFEQTTEGVITWNHFRVVLPEKHIYTGRETIPSQIGIYRDLRNVFHRSLSEITTEATETILDLISQKSLYKGEEWKSTLERFLVYQKEFNNFDGDLGMYSWSKFMEAGPVIGKIRNHSIGTLLVNLSEGVDLETAVRMYERIVAPSNYKRTKKLHTKRQTEEAEKYVVENGLVDSLPRRFAVADDLNINDILYTRPKEEFSVFDELKQEASSKPQKFDRVDEITIEEFIRDVLPRTKKLEVYMENHHSSNLMSIISPINPDAKPLFKWGNTGWAYNGNVTDSMKERVKSFGGNVDGVLRCSLQWGPNDNNDLDLHCYEPNNYHIFFQRMENYSTGGNLDVDIIEPKSQTKDGIAVENITWPNLDTLLEGEYLFQVHCYTYRNGKSGFQAEIEYNGHIWEFAYNKTHNRGYVDIARLNFTKRNGVEIIESLPTTTSTKQIWNLATNNFHPVDIICLSPNYWGDSQIGNKHYFFILKGCLNPDQPNGFFNEFLTQDLSKHKYVFEALGSKMKVAPSNDQLSGLGFSSTQRNELVVRVEGQIKRVLKIKF